METFFFLSFKKYCFSIKIIVDFSSNLIFHNIFLFIDDDKVVVVVVVEVGIYFSIFLGEFCENRMGNRRDDIIIIF